MTNTRPHYTPTPKNRPFAPAPPCIVVRTPEPNSQSFLTVTPVTLTDFPVEKQLVNFLSNTVTRKHPPLTVKCFGVGGIYFSKSNYLTVKSFI
jgi:hypothetical protein